jgi:hypothetical protein
MSSSKDLQIAPIFFSFVKNEIFPLISIVIKALHTYLQEQSNLKLEKKENWCNL